jgi:Mu-like prophage fluMu protein gp27
MEQMASKIRNAREVAEIWTKQFGEAPQSDIGKLLMEIVKNLAFETSIGMSENGKAEPKDLALLSSAIQRLEQAESLSFKREQAIRQETIKRAAEAVEEAGKQQGVSLADVQQMVKAVYGIE